MAFKYASKLSEEYVDPHQEKVEPDAFQEKYDSVYLSTISFIDTDTLEITKLNYTFIGTGNFKKRLLSSVEKSNRNKVTQPSIKFDYFQEGDADKGKLYKVTYPTGGSITYTYQSKTLEMANRELLINAPSGYSEPRVWPTENYTIITWRRPTTNELKVQVFEWSGLWKNTFSWDITGVELVVYNDKNFQDFEIFPGKDFFTIIRKYYSGTTYKAVNLIKREKNTDQWLNTFFWFSTKGEGTSLTDKKNNDDNNLTQVVNGDDYSFVYCPAIGSFSLFICNNSTWIRTDEDNPVFEGRPWLTDVGDYSAGDAIPHRFFATGMNNFIFIHDKKTSNSNSVDKWWIIYLDHEKSINLGNLHSSGTDLTRAWSNLYPSHNSVYETPMNHQEFWFNWNEDYTLSEHPLDAIANESEVFINSQSIGIGDNDGWPRRIFVYNYNGQSLQTGAVDAGFLHAGEYAFGDGFGLVYKRYNGYSNSWDSFIQTYYNPNTNLFETSEYIRNKQGDSERPKVGHGYFITNDTIFYKMPNQGSPFSWSRIGTVPKNVFTYDWGWSDDYSRTGQNYLVMKNIYTTGANHRNAIIFIKNGEIFNNQQIKIDDNPIFPTLLHNANHYPQVSNTMGSNTIVLS